MNTYNDIENDIEVNTSCKVYYLWIVFKEICYMVISVILIMLFLVGIAYQKIVWSDFMMYYYSWIIYIFLTMCRIVGNKYIQQRTQ